MDETTGLARPIESLLETARTRGGGAETLSVTARSLPDALHGAAADGRVPVIAEVKPTSPTATYEQSVDPVAVAESMVAGGAAAISVLTEPEHFGGSTESLSAIREAVSVPVLRKDFVLERDHLDHVAADAVLLIARFLEDLPGMIEATRDRGMQPLVEVHTEAEVEAALSAGAAIIGINNRDLARLEVDRRTFERVAPAVPEDVTLVAESGIETPAHASTMLEAGADGLLIGSAIMDGDVEANTRQLVHS